MYSRKRKVGIILGGLILCAGFVWGVNQTRFLSLESAMIKSKQELNKLPARDKFNKVTKSIKDTCTDSDGGLNFSIRGVTKFVNTQWADQCVTKDQLGNTTNIDSCSGKDCFITEFYCEKDRVYFLDGTISYKNEGCSNGCNNGACDSQIVQTETIILNSVIVDGDDVIVDYSKNFDTCVHMYDATFGKIMHTKNLFCINNGPIRVKWSDFDRMPTDLHQVYMIHGNNGNIRSSLTKINTVSQMYNYFDYCWEYDCNSQIPYAKLAQIDVPTYTKVVRNFKANARINVIVVFLYGHDPLPQDKVNILMSDASDVRGFKYAQKWFKDSAEKYGKELNVSIDFSDQQYKVPTDYVVENLFNHHVNLGDYVKTNFPQYSSYDVIVPFYYSSVDNVYYNHMSDYNSFTIFSKQPAPGFFYPDFESDSLVASFIHEMTHILGARDKYTCLNPSSEECRYAKENGVGCIIESDNPLEQGRDVMCHRIGVFENDWGWLFMKPAISQQLITNPTAKEIGWIDIDQDGIIEIDDPCPLLRDNSC